MDMFKEYLRMCRSNGCDDCPIGSKRESYYSCKEWINDHYDEAVSIIRKWAEEHPQKTYAQDFCEKFPNARKYKNAELCFCVRNVYGVKCPKISSQMRCKDCWNRTMEE